MGQMMVVTLREGIEMFLIVAIAATYLSKTGRRELVSAVGWGTGTALLASVVLGGWLAEVAVTPAWESGLALVAAVLVISMVVYMLSAAKHLRRHIGEKLDVAAARPGRGAWIGVFLFVVLMITREGMETAFLAASLFRQTESQHFVLGVLGGLLADHGCSQVVRAWLTTPYGDYRVTAGLFNLADAAGAVDVDDVLRHLVETGDGGFGDGTFATLATGGAATSQVGWRARGHYLLYCVINRPDDSVVAADDPYAARITDELVDSYLGTTVLGRRAAGF